MFTTRGACDRARAATLYLSALRLKSSACVWSRHAQASSSQKRAWACGLRPCGSAQCWNGTACATSCFPRSCASLALRSVTYSSVLHEPNGRAKQGHDQKRSARSSEVFAKGTRDSSLSASMKYFDRMGATPSEFRLEIIFSAYKCEVDTVIMI